MSPMDATEPAETLVLAEAPARIGSVQDFLELTKPRLTSLVALTALVGYLAGSQGPIDVGNLLAALIGTTLLAAGGCAINQVMEVDLDARMERTRDRPIPSGRLQPLESAVFGAIVTASGFVLLAAGTNTLTTLLGLTAVVSYLAIYTPLKRTTGLCTLVGALPGALPPAMGWVAATGRIEAGTWMLFSILFLWQLPHFLSIAWMRRDDYVASGCPMLSVLDPDGSLTSRQAVLYCLALLPVSLLPTVFGIAGPLYFVSALFLGLAYTMMAGGLAWQTSFASARRLFLTSLAYLPILLIVLVMDKVPR